MSLVPFRAAAPLPLTGFGQTGGGKYREYAAGLPLAHYLAGWCHDMLVNGVNRRLPVLRYSAWHNPPPHKYWYLTAASLPQSAALHTFSVTAYRAFVARRLP